jgi:hypothetical protein
VEQQRQARAAPVRGLVRAVHIETAALLQLATQPVDVARLCACRQKSRCATCLNPALCLLARRRDLDDLIMAMDDFVPPGSEVHLYNDVPVGDREVLLLNGGLNVDSLQVGMQIANPDT